MDDPRIEEARRTASILYEGQKTPHCSRGAIQAGLAVSGELPGDARKSFCTGLVATVAALVAGVALRHGAPLEGMPFAG